MYWRDGIGKAEMIRVYHFKLWNQQLQKYLVAPYKSSADLISHIGGVILTDPRNGFHTAKVTG